MSQDKPTAPPPKRVNTRTFLASGADSRHVRDAQAWVLQRLRESLKESLVTFLDALARVLRTRAGGAIDMFVDGQRDAIREALLAMGLPLYQDGIKVGQASVKELVRAWIALRDARDAAALAKLDARAEFVAPVFTADEVHAELARGGVAAKRSEVVEAARVVGLPLAEEPPAA